MSALCESIGADVTDVARAVGSDGRVGGAYLNAGVGFSGPSLQKDVLLLAYACEWHGLAEAAEYWRQVVAVLGFFATHLSETGGCLEFGVRNLFGGPVLAFRRLQRSCLGRLDARGSALLNN
jgi:hypothetical protein